MSYGGYDDKNLMVKGLPVGIILVCDPDGERALFEDAACTVKVDSIRWKDQSSACRFEVKLEDVCNN